MNTMMTKKIGLLILLLWMTSMSFSQDFLPTLNDNYMGINQASLQPAAIADSRFKLDINFVGFNSEILNDYVRFETKGIFRFKAMVDDPDWWNKYTSMSDPNGKAKNAIVNQTIMGPSFMISLGSKHAIGFTYKLRSILNTDNVDEPMARSIYDEYRSPEYWNNWYHGTDRSAIHHMLADYGLTYATEVFNLNQHYMKAGVTVKLVQGLGAAYLHMDNTYYYLYKPNGDPGNDADYASWNTDYAYFGVSDNWGSIDNTGDFDFSWKYKFVAKPSFGLDLGVVYEFRPRIDDYRYDMDGVQNLERRDQNKYLLRVGASILDIGRLRYEKMHGSEDFSAQFTPNYSSNPNPIGNTNWMFLDDVVFGFPPYVTFADSIQQRYAGGSTTGNPLGKNEETFTMKLPTAFSFQADVNIVKGLYVNVTTFTALKQKTNNVPAGHYISNYSLTPRYEHRWFSAAIPITYNEYKKVDVGLGIRVAFIYFGINNLFSGLFTDPYGSSFYFGVKVPIWQGKPPADRDGDGVSDAKDQCIDTPGLWDYRGCPDTDGDGIPDKDDKCPKDPGPSLTFGCPDRDNDGVLDNMDQCPDVPGPAQFNGCPDTDGDGIRDEVDKCPEIPGTQAANGCPDMDNDGVADMEDLCPEEFGKPEYNGCPFQDSDGDGIMDDNDLCPKQPGPPENNGCPWTDTDGDGVWDKDDRCPLTPGDPQNFGCPIIKTEEAAILKTAFENLEFETGKAIIRAGSFGSLDELARLLNEKPTWKLHIAGHTDNVGNDNSNMTLSKNRAESTAKYLQGKGIAPSRFIVEWFGETKPIADNGTAEGRQKNRRVEMEIVFD